MIAAIICADCKKFTNAPTCQYCPPKTSVNVPSVLYRGDGWTNGGTSQTRYDKLVKETGVRPAVSNKL